MSDIELVIKIPEETYNKIHSDEFFLSCGLNLSDVYDSIKNGKPLPKEHGRIADMDEAIKCIKEVEGEDAVWAIGLIEWACGKRIIIESDKEQEE